MGAGVGVDDQHLITVTFQLLGYQGHYSGLTDATFTAYGYFHIISLVVIIEDDWGTITKLDMTFIKNPESTAKNIRTQEYGRYYR
jgi:hypothetical protein